MAPSAIDPPVHAGRTNYSPDVPDFNSKTATPEEVVQGLIRSGGCILRNAASLEELAAIEADTRPWIDKDLEWKGDESFPRETRRVCGLATKSKAYMEVVVANKLYQDVCNILLSSTFKMWKGDELMTSTAAPQLNNTFLFSIQPGAADQGLHRDDIIHHNHLPAITADEYKVGRDLGIGYFVAGKRTTKSNGATRFIPGSHLWGPIEPRPTEDLCVYAELNLGDAFIMLASAYHGGSANKTTDQERLIYSCFMTKGMLRQEENQYLAHDREKLAAMYGVDMLRILGYDVSKPGLGLVNFDTPLKLLLGDKISSLDTVY